jgi:hypothetical protein
MKILRSWDEFFFKEKPTEGIALFRIIWMGLILVYFLMDLGSIDDLYGPHGIISHNTTRNQFPYFQVNLFNLFKQSYEVTYGIIIVYGISLVASILGLFTRSSLIVALICMISLHQRNIWVQGPTEFIMRMVTILLIFAPCGHSFSLDSYLSRFFPQFKRKTMWSVWALRLIQIQISLIYLWCFWHKLDGNMTPVLASFSYSLPIDSNLIFKTLNYTSLFIGGGLAVLLWVKRWRNKMLIAGVLYHAINSLFMDSAFYDFFMMALLLNFYSPEELKAFVKRTQNAIKISFEDMMRGQHETAN